MIININTKTSFLLRVSAIARLPSAIIQLSIFQNSKITLKFRVDKEITVVKQATHYNAIFKNETIKNALLRLI